MTTMTALPTFATIATAAGFDPGVVAASISNRSLELTILPTHECNFRCTYCYESFDHGTMLPHVVQGLKALVDRRVAAGLEYLKVDWFGGEPLMAKKVVHELGEYFARVAREHKVDYEAAMTTNAYLLDVATATRLVQAGCDHYQVSLDGWKEGHDRTRRARNGGPTFERIWSNLLALRETDLKLEIQLRVHLTPDNVETIEELCRHIGEEFAGDKRFVMSFQDIRDLSTFKKNDSVTPMDMADFALRVPKLRALTTLQPWGVEQQAQALAAAQREAAQPNKVIRGEAADRKRAKVILGEVGNSICYAAKPAHWLVRADGVLGKCTVALDDHRNKMGQLHADGTMTIETDKARLWYRGFETFDQHALACPWPGLPQLPATAKSTSRIVPIVALAA